MPVFEIQADGKTYEVDAPDQQQALAGFQAMMGGGPPPAAPPRNALDQQPNIGAKGDMLAGDRVQPDLTALALQGGTIGAADEIVSAARAPIGAALNAAFGDGPTDPTEVYNQNQAHAAAQLAATREAYPKLAPAVELGGGLATAGVGAAKLIGQGRSLLSKSGIGASTGAATSAAYGFNTGDGLGDRVGQAIEQAPAGFFTGAALPPLAQGAGALVRAVTPSGQRAAAKALDVTKAAVERIKRGFDDSVNTGSLRAAERGDMLLDLSPQFRGQAEAIATQPGAGGQSILNAVYARREGAGSRIQEVLDTGLGTDKGRAVVRSVHDQERKAAGQMLEAARKSPAMFDIDPIRGKVNQLADGIVGREAQSVRLVLERVPQGNVDAKTLHLVRMELDDDIGAAFRAGRTNQANALKDVRSDVDGLLKGQVKGWKEADAAFSLAKTREEAFDAGRGVFQRQVSPDELRQELSTMPTEIRQAVVQGARDSVSTIMGTARNDAGAAIRELTEKGWNREKLELLLGKGPATRIVNALEREKRFTDTLTTLAGNSRTAMRQAAQREFPNPIDRSANVQQAASGGISGAAMNAVFRVADMLVGGALNRRNARTAEDAAKLLTSTGFDRDRIISTLKALGREKGRALNRAEIAREIVNSLSVPASLAAGQLATQ